MKAPSPRASEHRYARLMTWARVWCVMLLRLLPAQGLGMFAPVEARLRAHLRMIRHAVLMLIFLRAMARLGLSTHKRNSKSKRPAAAIRMAIGARLRRITRGRTVRAQVEALLAVLINAEDEIARMMRRFERGFRGGRSATAHACVLTLIAADAPPAGFARLHALADTS